MYRRRRIDGGSLGDYITLPSGHHNSHPSYVKTTPHTPTKVTKVFFNYGIMCNCSISGSASSPDVDDTPQVQLIGYSSLSTIPLDLKNSELKKQDISASYILSV